MQLLASRLRVYRIVKFGNNPNDLIWKWINWIDKDNILYDIGSANGLEGFSLPFKGFNSLFYRTLYSFHRDYT